MSPFIDPEFRALIPPLTPEEYSGLEKSLTDEGCRDALVLWEGIIVDGHNRYEICRREDIPFKVLEKSFEDREAAKDWIDANQLSRRNLTPDQMSLLRGRRYNRLKKAQGFQDAGPGRGKTIDQNDPMFSTADRLAKEHGVSAPTIKRDGQFAKAVEELKPVVPGIERLAMSGSIPSKQAVIEAAKTPEKASEILKPHVSHNTGENEWYTPPAYIKAARKVMGKIDLDPASSLKANNIVKATTFYTRDNSGLKQDWFGNIWMNPPYSSDLIKKFVSKFAQHFKATDINQGIVLVNNATETAWFLELVSCASAVVFTSGRVKFLDPEGRPGAPLQGQALIYFGDNKESFFEEFSGFGWGAVIR